MIIIELKGGKINKLLSTTAGESCVIIDHDDKTETKKNKLRKKFLKKCSKVLVVANSQVEQFVNYHLIKEKHNENKR